MPTAWSFLHHTLPTAAFPPNAFPKTTVIVFDVFNDLFTLTPSVQQQHVLESSAPAEASGPFTFSWSQPNGRKLLSCLLLMYSLSVAYKSHGTEDCKRLPSRTWEGSGGGERWNAIKRELSEWILANDSVVSVVFAPSSACFILCIIWSSWEDILLSRK